MHMCARSRPALWIHDQCIARVVLNLGEARVIHVYVYAGQCSRGVRSGRGVRASRGEPLICERSQC